MSDNTAIEWTDATWNPIGGCSIKSPGCINCYAQTLCGTRLARHPLYAGTTTPVKGKHVFNGKLTAAPDGHPVWTWPLKWRGAKQPKLGPGQPSLIFVGDMSDLFHEDRPDEVIDRVIATGALCPPHILQLLTKRTDRMLDYLTKDRLRTVADFVAPYKSRHFIADEADVIVSRSSPPPAGIKIFGDWVDFTRPIRDGSRWPLPNFWLGFSAERQQEFDERWPHMRELAAAGWTIFVSIEPMIGRVVLPADFLALGRRAQVICGGESGRDARPLHPAWPRALRDQCAPAGIAFFLKQHGEWCEVEPGRWEGPPEAVGSIFMSNIHPGDIWMRRDGLIGDGKGDPSSPPRIGDPVGMAILRRVGKARAGRLLDGREHSEFPNPGART